MRLLKNTADISNVETPFTRIYIDKPRKTKTNHIYIYMRMRIRQWVILLWFPYLCKSVVVLSVSCGRHRLSRTNHNGEAVWKQLSDLRNLRCTAVAQQDQDQAVRSSETTNRCTALTTALLHNYYTTQHWAGRTVRISHISRIYWVNYLYNSTIWIFIHMSNFGRKRWKYVPVKDLLLTLVC